MSEETRTRQITRFEASTRTQSVLLSLGMSGVLMAMGALSFPLKFTPVPFSMMPFGLLVNGVVQRPGYAVLSVAIYLLAGALGLPVYAEGESGFHHLIGSTAGYLYGFLLVSLLVSLYLRAPRPVVSKRIQVLATTLLFGSWLSVLTIIVLRQGTGLVAFDDGLSAWGWSASSLYLMSFLIVSAALAALAWVATRRGDRTQFSQHFLVLLGSIVLLHACGVTVLWLSTPLSLEASIVLGSLVFLPLDVVKAGLAALFSLPWIPSSTEVQP